MARAGSRLLGRWRNNPPLCMQEATGLELWSRQAEVAVSVVHNERTAVRSGHKVGKSMADVGIALWWALTRRNGKAVLCAPSGHQIRDILWPELQKLYRESRFPIAPRPPSPDPFGGWQLSPTQRIFAVTADNQEGLAGLSGHEILFIVDEASGFKLWEPIYGNMAGGGKLLATGNPTQTSGEFFDAFHGGRDFWSTLHISALESPNVVEGREVIKGLATREYCEKRLREWGQDNPLYQVRVLGNFPGQGPNAVVGLELVEQASEQWGRRDPRPTDLLELGVDVARYGDDDSVVQPRRGLYAYPYEQYNGLDGPELADKVLQTVRRLRRDSAERPRVKVDVIGVGASCYDALARCRDEVDAVAVNVSEKPTGEGAAGEQFANLRAQIAFATRDWLRAGGVFQRDKKLEAELLAPRFRLDPRGRYQVESKDDIKKRLKHSPDRGDALGLAVYSPPPVDMHVASATNDRFAGFMGAGLGSRSFSR